jgi:hypothetical protein
MHGTSTMRFGAGAAIARWWQRLRHRRTLLAEFDRMGTGVDLLAHDLNLSTANLRALAAELPESADLLCRRLAGLKLDPQSIPTGVLRDLERVCTLCKCKDECEHDLAARGENADLRDYCPNAVTLDALQGRSSKLK